MKKSVEELIYPNELLREKLPYFERRYMDDYGEEYGHAIKSRMNNTLYLFESDPVVTMDFVKERGNDISDRAFLRRAEKEYQNYIRVKKVIHDIQRQKYYSKLSSYFSLLPYPIREDILNLDIEAYSYENVHKAKIDGDLKALERQEEYCRQCKKLGVKPITDPTYVHFILTAKERLDKQEKKLLLKNTRWGRRMIKIMKKYYPKITLEDMVTLFEKNYAAYTAYLLNEQGVSCARIMYYPLLKNLDLRDLDGIFYHENRHVIESTAVTSGLQAHRAKYYRLLNEIRTEKNAGLDKKYFDDDYLWSTDGLSNDYYNLYVQLFPYTATFFEENREFLNDCAIRGDINALENKFGAGNLIGFEQFLCYLASELRISQISEFDDERLEEGNIILQKMQIKK